MFHFKSGARRQIKIKEVRGNTLILPDHHYCQILETSSVNFELKSEEEKNIITDSFQNFLNSISSPIQSLKSC